MLVAALLLTLAPATVDPPRVQSDLPKVQVGSSLVNGSRLRPYKNEWRMKLIKHDGSVLEDAGTWHDELKTCTVKRRSCWQRSQRAEFKKKDGEIAATTYNANVFDRQTFAPISRLYEKHIFGKSDSSLSIQFNNKTIKITSIENGETKTSQCPASKAFDFYGGVYAVLWAAFPLKEGFAASLESYSEDGHPEKTSWVTFYVRGRSRIEAGPGRMADVWLVTSDTTIGLLKYWISEEPPYVIKMDYVQTSGDEWILTMT